MLKLLLRTAITLIDLALLIALWWVIRSTPPTPPDVLSVNVENVAPEEVSLILEATGADEDGDILNEDNE